MGNLKPFSLSGSFARPTTPLGDIVGIVVEVVVGGVLTGISPPFYRRVLLCVQLRFSLTQRFALAGSLPLQLIVLHHSHVYINNASNNKDHNPQV